MHAPLLGHRRTCYVAFQRGGRAKLMKNVRQQDRNASSMLVHTASRSYVIERSRSLNFMAVQMPRRRTVAAFGPTQRQARIHHYNKSNIHLRSALMADSMAYSRRPIYGPKQHESSMSLRL
jgi:hypothetical protein